MNKTNEWIDIVDISMWKTSPFDTMFSDLRGIQIAFSRSKVSVNNRIRILSRVESYSPALIVQQEKTGSVFLTVVGKNPYAISILDENDKLFILDGELCIEDISWLPAMKIVVFLKHYILHNEFQKVIVGYEGISEHWKKEESIKDENYLFETHYKFNYTESDPLPWIIPEDW